MDQKNGTESNSNKFLKKLIMDFHCWDGFGPMFIIIVSLITAYFFILYVPPKTDSRIFGYITITGVVMYLLSNLIEKYKLFDLIRYCSETESKHYAYSAYDNSFNDDAIMNAYDDVIESYNLLHKQIKAIITEWDASPAPEKSNLKREVDAARELLSKLAEESRAE